MRPGTAPGTALWEPFPGTVSRLGFPKPGNRLRNRLEPPRGQYGNRFPSLEGNRSQDRFRTRVKVDADET